MAGGSDVRAVLIGAFLAITAGMLLAPAVELTGDMRLLVAAVSGLFAVALGVADPSYRRRS